ncbi:MAG: DUF4065 domain-containing protein [Alphaproteobacteria bacterium]
MNIIKKLREQKSCSQEDLANAIGVSRQTIIKYESAESQPTIEVVKKLSEFFDVDYACFIDNKLPQQHSYDIVEAKKEDCSSNDIRITIPQNNIDKFKQVLLYILQKIGAKPNVGETVIYKLLYFIDFDYYELYEEQLMGLRYIKNTFGPTPVDFHKLVKKMELEGLLEEVKTKFYDKDMTKYLPTAEYDLSLLNGNEIKHIDAVLAKLADKTAKELSDLSHKDIPWIAANMREPIEYEAVFYRTPETSVRTYND